jgi:uncharacterized membrane protein
MDRNAGARAMKALKIAAVILASIVGVCCAGALYAQQRPPAQQNATFELAMCNMSDFQGVFVALMHKQDAQKWIVNGWYAIPDQGCTFLGSFLRDTVYYYAESNDNAVWRGADTDQSVVPQCIDHDKLFQGPAGVKSCPAGEVGIKFRTIKVSPTTTRLTLPLTGRK